MGTSHWRLHHSVLGVDDAVLKMSATKLHLLSALRQHWDCLTNMGVEARPKWLKRAQFSSKAKIWACSATLLSVSRSRVSMTAVNKSCPSRIWETAMLQDLAWPLSDGWTGILTLWDFEG